MKTEAVQDEVRARYAAAARTAAAGGVASCGDPAPPVGNDGGCGCGGGCAGQGEGCGCGGSGHGRAVHGPAFGARLYPAADLADLPEGARLASLGCGNPLAVADLAAGETVLDLGSGGGGDVLLSARRVGPGGHVYGLDMTDEMLDLARRNAADAGTTNVEFRKGTIEEIPLPDSSVDVVISNCVINLSADKPAVFAQMHRVLRPGGRLGMTDVVADDTLTLAQRAERGDWAGCVAGALSRSEYVAGLAAAGFARVEVVFTHEVADGIHSAIIRAVRP
jgi:arsenite methyltransferase